MPLSRKQWKCFNDWQYAQHNRINRLTYYWNRLARTSMQHQFCRWKTVLFNFIDIYFRICFKTTNINQFISSECKSCSHFKFTCNSMYGHRRNHLPLLYSIQFYWCHCDSIAQNILRFIRRVFIFTDGDRLHFRLKTHFDWQTNKKSHDFNQCIGQFVDLSISAWIFMVY